MRRRGKQGSGEIPVLLLGTATAVASLALLATQGNLWLALAPPLALPALFFLWRRPEYGYYAIVALVPMDAWRNAITGSESSLLSVSKFLGLWILLAIVVKEATAPEFLSRLKTTLWRPLAALAAVAALSSIFSRWAPDTIPEFKKLFTAYLIFGLTLYLMRERHFRIGFPAVLIGSVTLSAALGVIGSVFQVESLMMEVSSDVKERAVGVTADPNFFAAMTLCTIPLLIHFFFEARGWWMRFLMGALFFHNTAAIMLTYSRASILVWMLIVLLFGARYLLRLRPKHFGFILLGAGILAVYALAVFTQTSAWKRLQTLSDPGQDRSLMRRISYVKLAKTAFRENPILGSGLGAFPYIYERSAHATGLAARRWDTEELRRYAHNTYLEVLVGTGLAGLICFLGALFIAMRYYLIARRRLAARGLESEASYARALQYGFAAFLLALVFISDVYHKYIWIFLALSVIAWRESERKSEVTS